MENQIQELLNETNLNWSVRTELLQTSSGIQIPDKICIVRNDDSSVLGIHSNGYVPYQNEQMMELLYKVSNKTGLKVHSGGHFKDGGKVYVQLKSDDLRIGTDRVEGYITGINSFDGSTSLSFGPSSKTISCQNTFWGVYRGLNNKVRHTKSLEIKVEEIVNEINKVEQIERQMFDNIIKLSETRVGQNDIDNVIRQLFNIDRNVDFKDEDSLSTVTRNKLSNFYVDLNGEMRDKGDNLWGLFSGVTKFTTHSISKNDNTENKIFGTYGNREREIYQSLVELV
jgi:phage/plasmid-like protein (TIGR03299 family)